MIDEKSGSMIVTFVAKLKKLQRKVGGAQLHLRNTEKKLKIALDAVSVFHGASPHANKLW